MTYSICITTVNRPYREYTFRRLLDTKTLTHPLVRGFHVAYERLPNPNTDVVFRAALCDGADWILFLEDDIDLIDDFIGSTDRWLHEYAIPEVQFYPLGCGVRHAMQKARRAGARMWEWPLKEFFGATALALRPAFVQAFCEMYATRPAWITDPTGLDENLKGFHRQVAPTITTLRTPVPCFIDHRGAVTSQTTAAEHWTGSYIGWEGPRSTYP